MTDYRALALQVAEIARRAGAAIMDIYENEADFGVEIKDDDSPLTRADRAANTIIVEALAQLEFQAPIISEENKEVPYPERRQYTRFWLVDPLDGTKEFIKRNGEFTVNIALIDGLTPLLGVVYVPARDALYYGIKQEGAYRQQGGQETRLTAQRFSLTDTGLRVVASRSHRNAETQSFIDNLREPIIVSCGSSLKLLLLAAAEADVYPRLGPTMEWDIAAAQIILEEAGGKVVNEATGVPIMYNKPQLLNPHFIAYGDLQ